MTQNLEGALDRIEAALIIVRVSEENSAKQYRYNLQETSATHCEMLASMLYDAIVDIQAIRDAITQEPQQDD